MKRFIAFDINYYYPQGGMDDMICSFETRKELIDWMTKNKWGDTSSGCVQGFDRETGEIIEQKEIC